MQKVSRRVRKGIPDAKRRAAWNSITEVHRLVIQNPGLYERYSGAPVEAELTEMTEANRRIEVSSASYFLFVFKIDT